MTVSEALQLPSFSTAQVIAGNIGLGNTITSAMILEAPDIENWGQKGQLIITSFYALQNLSGQALADFFEKLVRIGISALVFKSERLLHKAPPEVIAHCNKHAIPLLQVSRDVKYESILLDVLGPIMDSNLTLLNHFFDVHNQMMELALKQPSIYQILVRLKKALQADATFFNVTQNKKISSNPAQSKFVRFELEDLAPNRYQHYRYYRALLFYDDGFTANALAVPVPSSDENSYYLIIHDGLRSHQHIDIMTIENIVSLLQMETLKQNAIEQKLFVQNNNAVHELLNSSHASHERVDSLLNGLHLDRHPSYQVLMVSVRLPAGEENRYSDLIPPIRKRIKFAYPNLAYFESMDQIVFLHNFAREGQSIQMEEIKSNLERLLQDPHLPPFTYLAALSQSGNRYAIDGLNREVMDICRLFDNTREENRCIRYEDLGAYKLFLKVENAAELESYLDPRILRLREESRQLLNTLVILCESNLNYQGTAQRLFMHPKTIHYRVSRIQQLYKLDVHNTEDFLQILLAGKVLLLLNEHP